MLQPTRHTTPTSNVNRVTPRGSITKKSPVHNNNQHYNMNSEHQQTISHHVTEMNIDYKHTSHIDHKNYNPFLRPPNMSIAMLHGVVSFNV